jgi:Gas vesicle synthesis protein GvpO
MQREDDGWSLCVEVVELRRVPDTTSLLATYELHLDTDGGLAGWARTRRYERGRADRH